MKKMFYGAQHFIFQNAQKLRLNMTPSEIKLWEYLKKRPLGFKFRRQHPIGPFITDFYCHGLKLVIEVDGNIHDTEEAQERDINRQVMIESEGIKVIRFRNEEINSRLETVIEHIEKIIVELKNEPAQDV